MQLLRIDGKPSRLMSSPLASSAAVAACARVCHSGTHSTGRGKGTLIIHAMVYERLPCRCR